MTVSEMIKALSAMPADAVVHFAYDYGDHVHTIVAPVVESVELGAVKDSRYHAGPILIEDGEELCDDGEDGSEGADAVVVIR